MIFCVKGMFIEKLKIFEKDSWVFIFERKNFGFQEKSHDFYVRKNFF